MVNVETKKNGIKKTYSINLAENAMFKGIIKQANDKNRFDNMFKNILKDIDKNDEQISKGMTMRQTAKRTLIKNKYVSMLMKLNLCINLKMIKGMVLLHAILMKIQLVL